MLIRWLRWVFLPGIVALAASGCGASSDPGTAASDLRRPYATIAECFSGEGIDRVRSKDDAPILWRDIAADNVQDAGGGGSGGIAYRGIQPVGGTATSGDYRAFMIQALSEPYTAREIIEKQPNDALLVYVEGADAGVVKQVQACIGRG